MFPEVLVCESVRFPFSLLNIYFSIQDYLTFTTQIQNVINNENIPTLRIVNNSLSGCFGVEEVIHTYALEFSHDF